MIISSYTRNSIIKELIETKSVDRNHMNFRVNSEFLSPSIKRVTQISYRIGPGDVADRTSLIDMYWFNS